MNIKIRLPRVRNSDFCAAVCLVGAIIFLMVNLIGIFDSSIPWCKIFASDVVIIGVVLALCYLFESDREW